MRLIDGNVVLIRPVFSVCRYRFLAQVSTPVNVVHAKRRGRNFKFDNISSKTYGCLKNYLINTKLVCACCNLKKKINAVFVLYPNKAMKMWNVSIVISKKKKKTRSGNRLDTVAPVIPNDPRFAFDPMTYVDGLKLINMYEPYCHAM